jgi:hypothetical protein
VKKLKTLSSLLIVIWFTGQNTQLENDGIEDFAHEDLATQINRYHLHDEKPTGYGRSA